MGLKNIMAVHCTFTAMSQLEVYITFFQICTCICTFPERWSCSPPTLAHLSCLMQSHERAVLGSAAVCHKEHLAGISSPSVFPLLHKDSWPLIWEWNVRLDPSHSFMRKNMNYPSHLNLRQNILHTPAKLVTAYSVPLPPLACFACIYMWYYV